MIRSETELAKRSFAIRPFYDHNLYFVRTLSAHSVRNPLFNSRSKKSIFLGL